MSLWVFWINVTFIVNSEECAIKELIQQIQENHKHGKVQGYSFGLYRKGVDVLDNNNVILEEEKEGREWADYGEFLIKSLAEALEPQLGNGFSYRQLNSFRQFYRSFPIMNALRSQFSWTHYLTLIRIINKDKSEMNNLYGNPAYAKVQAMMKEKLKEVKERYKDPEPVIIP
jgi:hypothetical protein